MAIIKDTGGLDIFLSAPTGSYLANVNLRHAAADASGSYVFAMRNPLTTNRKVQIRRISLNMAFDAAAAVAGSSQIYEFVRFSAADPTTGTTINRIKRRPDYGISQINDANIQQKSGVLTMTGIVAEQPFHVARMPITVTGIQLPILLDFSQHNTTFEPLELFAGEGLGIRLGAAAVIGLSLSGSIIWDER